MQGHRLPAIPRGIDMLEVTGSNPGPGKINLIRLKKHQRGFLTLKKSTSLWGKKDAWVCIKSIIYIIDKKKEGLPQHPAVLQNFLSGNKFSRWTLHKLLLPKLKSIHASIISNLDCDNLSVVFAYSLTSPFIWIPTKICFSFMTYQVGEGHSKLKH